MARRRLRLTGKLTVMGRGDKDWGVTRSGFRYPRIPVTDLMPDGDEPFTWTCGEKNCGVIVQGGWSAVTEHRQVVHPEIYGMGLS
jgi:hypothetical protein